MKYIQTWPDSNYPHESAQFLFLKAIHFLSISGHDYDIKGPWEDNYEGGKKMILKDLFDLILTALAFLSFGLFIINIALPLILVSEKCFSK